MAILRWTPASVGRRVPGRELDRLKDQVEGLFENLLSAVEGVSLGRSGVYPLLNMTEDPDHVYVTAELPGVSASDLELFIENDNLTLRGERKIVEADKRVNYHRREREAGFFRRTIALPVKVDAAGVSAAMKDGILTVTLPKAVEAKPRKISVESI